ncbi:hypothetical protein NCCP133_13660 [Cytobacillus sp. NCCP-133]|nr:hypothetical protein NCCP133_13660 [Cytobacillus sp. NCCP-133]
MSLISKEDVLISRIENSIPTEAASRISVGVTRKYGTTNMSAPVLMKIGGKMIFLAEAGFLAAFMRINITKIAINTAPIDEINTKSMRFLPLFH